MNYVFNTDQMFNNMNKRETERKTGMRSGKKKLERNESTFELNMETKATTNVH